MEKKSSVRSRQSQARESLSVIDYYVICKCGYSQIYRDQVRVGLDARLTFEKFTCPKCQHHYRKEHVDKVRKPKLLDIGNGRASTTKSTNYTNEDGEKFEIEYQVQKIFLW